MSNQPHQAEAGISSPCEWPAGHRENGVEAALLRRQLDPSVNLDTPFTDLLERYSDCHSPHEPISLQEYLGGDIQELIDEAVNHYSPRSLGHMAGYVPPYVRRLNEIATQLNQNLAKWDASRAFTLMERQTISWVHRNVYQLPDEFYTVQCRDRSTALGMPVSGGTLANLAALWCARNRVFGFDPDAAGSAEYEGLARVLLNHGWERAVVIGSAMAHYSVRKAAGVLGIGRSGYLEADVDARGRVCIKPLHALLRECRRRRWCVVAVVGIAGNTDCGAIDPLEAIADLCAESGTPFHVDGAWITPWVLSPHHRSAIKGIERADSVSLDGHKQLHHPIGSSLLLWRDPASSGAIRQEAAYMARRESWDQGRFALEGSRPASILYFHATLRLNGATGFDLLVKQSLERMRIFRDLVTSSADFELLVEPTTNVVLYRFLPPEFRDPAVRAHMDGPSRVLLNQINQAVQERQANLGRTFVSRTCLRRLPQSQGHPLTALRAVLTNPLTNEEDLQAVLNDQRAIAEELRLEAVASQQPLIV